MFAVVAYLAVILLGVAYAARSSGFGTRVGNGNGSGNGGISLSTLRAAAIGEWRALQQEAAPILAADDRLPLFRSRLRSLTEAARQIDALPQQAIAAFMLEVRAQRCRIAMAD